jgi:hypothetical protein
VAIERELEFRFPKEYRSFLCDYGAAVFFGEGAIYRPLEPSPIVDDKGFQSVNTLYGPVDGRFGLDDVNRRFYDQLPPHVLAIGEAGFGDAICLAIVGAEAGRLYYWYHEDPDERRIYLIARSFDEFVDMLEPEAGFGSPIANPDGCG